MQVPLWACTIKMVIHAGSVVGPYNKMVIHAGSFVGPYTKMVIHAGSRVECRQNLKRRRYMCYHVINSDRCSCGLIKCLTSSEFVQWPRLKRLLSVKHRWNVETVFCSVLTFFLSALFAVDCVVSGAEPALTGGLMACVLNWCRRLSSATWGDPVQLTGRSKPRANCSKPVSTSTGKKHCRV